MTEQAQEQIIGDLTDEEKVLIENYQRRANQLVYQLGELEVRKGAILKEIGVVELEAGDAIRQIGARFDLAQDQLFKVVNGQVTLLGPPQKPRIIKG